MEFELGKKKSKSYHNLREIALCCCIQSTESISFMNTKCSVMLHGKCFTTTYTKVTSQMFFYSYLDAKLSKLIIRHRVISTTEANLKIKF